MKVRKSILRHLTVVFILFYVVISCTKDDTGKDYTYFVSKELAVSYSVSNITNLLNTVSGTLPEIDILKPLVKSDVDIYRMVYKTTLNGAGIKASGLICIPKTPGDYPVLSFQNGTNTLNSAAPSEFAIDYPYQLIEIIASMGYVVLIADYPGFGESAEVPHPYLITEPTVQSLVDMMYATREAAVSEFQGLTLKNEYYLLGYSQGGWATLALHKALELDYSSDFNLKGSACGAGPYNIYLLMQGMINVASYPMPVYLGFIINSYKSYNQFTNPAADILNEPYASRLGSLYTGLLTSDQINKQLTESIPGLINPDFLAGYATSPQYASVREALIRNSITPWHSFKPLLLLHGGADTQVNPVTTENMYSGMILAGTPEDICKKVILPGLDHGEGVAPCMIEGILFLMKLNTSR
jgi:hypothetical protein